MSSVLAKELCELRSVEHWSVELRNPLFAWHSEAQFAMLDVFLSEALVSLSTLRAKVVRLVACDG